MPEPTAEVYSYACLRVVPSIERGEALNVGVALFCKRHDLLAVRISVDEQRLHALDPDLECRELSHRLDAIQRLADGKTADPLLRAMSKSDRFGWIAAPSNTLIQPGQIHTGVTTDPQYEIERLFKKLVLV